MRFHACEWRGVDNSRDCCFATREMGSLRSQWFFGLAGAAAGRSNCVRISLRESRGDPNGIVASQPARWARCARSGFLALQGLRRGGRTAFEFRFANHGVTLTGLLLRNPRDGLAVLAVVFCLAGLRRGGRTAFEFRCANHGVTLTGFEPLDDRVCSGCGGAQYLFWGGLVQVLKSLPVTGAAERLWKGGDGLTAPVPGPAPLYAR